MSTTTTRNLVLNSVQVEQKIKRIAFEIYEHNFQEKRILLAGIDGQGYVFAKMLKEALEGISPISVKLLKVSLDKFSSKQGEVRLDVGEKELKNRCVVLIDDVLNTGKTLAFGMQPFLNAEIKRLEVAVLINRRHTQYPILPTYTGYALATMISEHVEVVLGKRPAVYIQ